MDELREALQPVARAMRAMAAALTALREQLLIDAGRRDELLRRVEAQLERVEGPPPVENARVAEARADLAIDRITLYRRALGAPITLGRWLAADRIRTGALLVALGGVVAQISSGAPIIATLGRALLAWGTSSAGGAP